MKSIKKVKNNTKKLLLGASVVAGYLINTIPVYAAGDWGKTTVSKKFTVKNIVSIFTNIGLIAGAIYGAASLFTLILAMRNEDNEGRNKAALNLAVAVGLLSLGAIFKVFGF